MRIGTPTAICLIQSCFCFAGIAEPWLIPPFRVMICNGSHNDTILDYLVTPNIVRTTKMLIIIKKRDGVICLICINICQLLATDGNCWQMKPICVVFCSMHVWWGNWSLKANPILPEMFVFKRQAVSAHISSYDCLFRS